MRSYPASFYQTAPAVTLTRTDQVTGVLHNPLDIVTHPRPWVQVAVTSPTAPTKKKLIFADHLHQKRGTAAKKNIHQALFKAREDGFEIFILTPQGVLQAWDGNRIPRTYILPLAQFTPDKIYAVAWQQCQFSAADLMILDYFGLNELLERVRNFINFSDFDIAKDGLPLFNRLSPVSALTLSFEHITMLMSLPTETVPDLRSCRNLGLIGNLDTANLPVIQLFLQQLSPLETLCFRKCNNISPLVSLLSFYQPLKTIAMSFAECSADALQHLLSAAPNLQSLMLEGGNISHDFTLLQPNQLPNLKLFSVKGLQTISDEALLNVIRAAPNMTCIDSSRGALNRKIVFNALRNNQLPHLKEMNLSDTDISSADLMALFRAAPYLSSIHLSHCRGIENAFSSLQPNQLTHLKKIDLSYATINTADITALLHAAPNLSSLGLNDCPAASAFSSLRPNQLSHLSEVNLSGTKVSAVDMTLLLQAAPNIACINLNICKAIANAFSSLRPNQLPHLKEINLRYSDTSAADLIALFRAAPYLSSIHLSHCRGIENAFSSLQPNQLTHLKTINLANTNVDSADVMALLHAAPYLASIALGYCSNNANAFSSLQPNQLPFLKEIDLSSSDVTARDIAALLAAAPNLAHIKFPEHKKLENAFVLLKPNQLGDLEKISLGNSQVSATDVSALLHATSNVESFRLTSLVPYATMANAFISLKPHQLYFLKELTLSWVDTTPRDMIALLQAAPNITSIALLCCTNIENAFASLDFNQWKQLTQIRIIDTPLSQGDRNAFLAVSRIRFDESQSAAHDTHFYPTHSPGAAHLQSDEIFNAQKDPKKQFTYKAYFPHLPPSHYRLFLWTPDLHGRDLRIPAITTLFRDFQPMTREVLDLSNRVVHDGVMTTVPTDGTEIILPSLDAEEKLVAIQICDTRGESVTDFTVQYSNTACFYRVMLPTAGHFTIYFTVAIPGTKPILPDDIKTLVFKYCAYQEKSVTTPLCKDFQELITFIDTNQTGCCLHRAMAAFAACKTTRYAQLIQQARIVMNDVHAYLEIRINNRWIPLELGGYSVLLKPEFMPITPLNSKTAATPQPITAELTSDEYAIFAVEDSIVEQSLETMLSTEQPTVVIAESDQALETVLTRLQDSHLFIAGKPEDFNLSAFGFNREGAPIAQYTRFRRWMDMPCAPDKMRVICVDIRQFNARELAQLNDLLDKQIEGQSLHDIKIILIDRHREFYGPDFRRRVPQKTYVPFTTSVDLLKDIPDDSCTHTIIDLFHSAYWQQLLVGTWRFYTQVSGTLRCQWQEGPLLTALREKMTHIVFKNPPLTDTGFTTFVATLRAVRKIDYADQVLCIDQEVQFYQTAGYDWQALSQGMTIRSCTSAITPMVLSDENVLDFIKSPRFTFDSDNKLVTADSHLDAAKKEQGTIFVMCAYGLTESALALFLQAAQEKQVSVQFVIQTYPAIPHYSPLSKITPYLEITSSAGAGPTPSFVSPIEWYLHTDITYGTRALILQYPDAICVDISCLSAAELGHYPILPEKVRETFLTDGTFSMTAPLSDLLQKLQAGSTIILHGKIPTHLYTAVTQLALGKIEGNTFPGKLIILTQPDQSELAEAITGQQLTEVIANRKQKMNLLRALYPVDPTFEMPEDPQTNFAALERHYLQNQLRLRLQSQSTPLRNATHKLLHHIKCPPAVDLHRLAQVTAALTLSPWVMLAGPTGIGKSHFLQQILPTKFKVTDQLTEWLTLAPSILVIDEASFISELNGDANFLARFTSLDVNPPGFLWKGHYYSLTQDHKVIFAFNPESYGAGRSTIGFLRERAVSVSFNTLPDVYINTTVIVPFLNRLLPDLNDQAKQCITAIVLEIYNWICNHSPEHEILITPREIKAILNLITSKLRQDPRINLRQLTQQIAYLIGRQTLIRYPEQLAEFDTTFQPNAESTIFLQPISRDYLAYQTEAYHVIQCMLQMRTLLTREYPDPGLGGILLEGASGIGKSHFIGKIAQSAKTAGINCYHISPSTPFHEKEKILIQAFAQGALVLAEEFNTSLWPNKLLNNFLMGLDVNGQPASVPGFMLLATTNPPELLGREEIDPALRRRLMTFSLDWPRFIPVAERNTSACAVQASHLFRPAAPAEDFPVESSGSSAAVGWGSAAGAPLAPCSTTTLARQ